MRGLAFVLLVACGSRTTTVIAPAAPRTEERAADHAVEHCVERPTEGDAGKARRDQVRADLDKVDREIEAIDDELESGARLNGMTLADARAAVIERKALLDVIKNGGIAPDGTPRLLAHALHDLQQAKLERATLAADLGPQNPAMKRADARIKFFQEAVDKQLIAEVLFVSELDTALAVLPMRSTPDDVYKARIAVLRKSMKLHPPSESPAAVRLAIEAVAYLEFTRKLLEVDVGPKHPDLIAVKAQLDQAQAELATAISEADAELAARAATPPHAADPKAIARRAELADQARELRREYERLLLR